MSNNRALGEGDVAIVLQDQHGNPQHRVLKPTLYAIRSLSRKYGGLEPLISKIGSLQFDVIVDVVAMGMQIPNTPDAIAELEDSVFRTGLTDQQGGLPSLCVRYIICLMHGGRHPPQENQGVDGAQANPPGSQPAGT